MVFINLNVKAQSANKDTITVSVQSTETLDSKDKTNQDVIKLDNEVVNNPKPPDVNPTDTIFAISDSTANIKPKDDNISKKDTNENKF